jgi:nicotinamide mononucleotide transporter
MSESLVLWLTQNYPELLGAILGLVYIVLSVKQNIFTWPVGLLSSLLYVLVFFRSKFYAGMALQVYYVAMSIYGWYFWLKGNGKNEKGEVPVSRLKKKEFRAVAVAIPAIFGSILLILLFMTDSPVPYPDSLAAALSIAATWMLARKILENWLLWIISDVVSTGLMIYEGMWPSTILYVCYATLAVVGYFKWKQSILTAKP